MFVLVDNEITDFFSFLHIGFVKRRQFSAFCSRLLFCFETRIEMDHSMIWILWIIAITGEKNKVLESSSLRTLEIIRCKYMWCKGVKQMLT